MIKFIKKIFAKWFGIKEEVLILTESDLELTESDLEKAEHCSGHTRFRKSCSLCQAIIK